VAARRARSGGKNYISEPGTRVVLRVSRPGSVGSCPGQRRSIAFSKGPPKTRITRTSAAPSTTICHSATAQAAPPVSVGVMSGLQNCARQRGTLAPAFDTLVQYPSNGSNGSASRARAEDYRRRAQECLDVTRTLSLYDARATLIDMAFG
jgi:hypothetical protein